MASTSEPTSRERRNVQKLNLSTLPNKKKRHISEEDSSGFCSALQNFPPPMPPALLRRIDIKEVSGVGKVKIMLRVKNPSVSRASTPPQSSGANCYFSLDKRKKQISLLDPSIWNIGSVPEDRRVSVAAPKIFAFDAVFSQDDSQSEVCSSALTDIIHAVINGNDGCLFCFGHAGLGKSYTMLGTPDNANTLGIIPCAISWLFDGINERKQKNGARFSVRVSAVEICGISNQLKDLFCEYSHEAEHSPSVYPRNESFFGNVNVASHCELRVPTAERAAHYLDAVIEGRKNTVKQRDASRYSHLLFTLHVYQYSVAGKGGVAGGRSRLHLIDLGNSEPNKANAGIPLSGVGNILLAIFNGQKTLPYKEHKITQILKECLSSLACHAAMIVHVSPKLQHYRETLATVQLASRIHRMRRRRFRFISSATGNGSGGSSGEEQTKTRGTSIEPDPSSSDLSADTVIYIGRTEEGTDGEHPPVYIPSLNSGDNRCSMSKLLRGSIMEQVPRIADVTEEKQTVAPVPQRLSLKVEQSYKMPPAHISSNPKISTSKVPSIKTKIEKRIIQNAEKSGSEEQWIDGPRISKSKVVEARNLIKEHKKKCETWIDGPLQSNSIVERYGYMDSHKKDMIQKWVEHQTMQIQKYKHYHKETPKEVNQFKCEKVEILNPVTSKKQGIVGESLIRSGLKICTSVSESSLKCQQSEEEEGKSKDMEDDDDEPEIPPALPLIRPLSSREVSLESLDQLLKERMMSNAEYNYQTSHNSKDSDGDEILDLTEDEDSLNPVPTQDCCVQVTEQDIALCMGLGGDPLPAVDQENVFDHPLRILSQENLTELSTFTDAISVFKDLEGILPHHFDRKSSQKDEHYVNAYLRKGNLDENTKKQFDQLARLREDYSNSLAKANVTNSETYQKQTQNRRLLSRCESLTLSDMLYGEESLGHDSSSIYSEPAYLQEKFCENCKVSMLRPATSQHWYPEPQLSFSTQDVIDKRSYETFNENSFQSYCQRYKENIANLRHPDGASDPNLREKTTAAVETIACLSETTGPHDYITTQPLPHPNSLPSAKRMNRAILNLETGVTAIRRGHKSEGYDSGHDSTPRLSKRSPAAISRRAESGYESVMRDSENSSVESVPTRRHRRGKCKHKNEKSFCLWFLNPFTCKYIEEPLETHF